MIVSIFDRFAKPKPPKGYAKVTVQFTEEESEAMGRTLRRYAAVANAYAPEETEAIVPLKLKDGMAAQGLTEYVEDLMRQLRHSESIAEKTSLMDKALKAQMKAYAIHNLPVYLFQVAGMFEFVGDTANAKEFFQQFLRAQSDFKPDQIDTVFLKRTGFDMPKIVAMATEKVR
jgi:hypothetical protein